MNNTKLLVADRGEIAIRVMRAAAELGMDTVAVFAEDDAGCLHTRKADAAVPLSGRGPAAYRDIEQIIAVAKENGCGTIHPGLGESPTFAQRCAEEAITFVGPGAETVETLRDQAKARALAGRCDLPVEAIAPRTRHIEVQIIGDGTRNVSHLGERDGSIQRRGQKLVDMAPCPGISPTLRETLMDYAVRLAREIAYKGLGIVEFSVDAAGDGVFAVAFIRFRTGLTAGHTVTEEVTGIDLVKAQLQLAAGRTLGELGLLQADVPAPRGYALQVRINMETLEADGSAKPAGGTITAFEAPSGPGLRTDTHGYAGYAANPAFDPLLAKLVAHSPSPNFSDAVTRAYRGLCEFRIEGVPTNIHFLQNLLKHPEFAANRIHTRFIEDHAAELAAQDKPHQRLFFADAPVQSAPSGGRALAGAKIDDVDPLAVLDHGKKDGGSAPSPKADSASWADSTYASAEAPEEDAPADLDHLNAGLAEMYERRSYGLNANRPEAVARRRKTGHRTARENVEDLCDPGTLVEFGPIVIAAQRARRSLDDLRKNTPADGLITGVCTVNGHLFDEDRARCAVLAYDYTVLAGTQGGENHRKKDRMFELAQQWRLPVVFFCEGGGGRPGDTDMTHVRTLDGWAFYYFARLSGLVPLVGITTGRCFAGNAVLLGCCDVIIATEGSNIGMGGPAMVEGGGLGVFKPEEIGPMDVQVPNGVVDLVVADEAAAVQMAKRYLAYFQGPLKEWECPDQRLMRGIVPENRLRIYDIRNVIDTLADTGSVLEIRRNFGHGMITSLIRIEGRPIGVVANNPMHLAGAIDSDGADKGTRFMHLCDAFDIPILYLCDCPGIMVGPEIEKTALVRHCCRMFVVGANVTVPYFTVVLRKAYGLGKLAMAGGSFDTAFFAVAWPTGEFGGMGLEGAVKLGYRKELAAIEDPQERKATYEEMVAGMYERGKAVNIAANYGVDDTIDPADTRKWLVSSLRSVPPPEPSTGKKHAFVNTW